MKFRNKSTGEVLQNIKEVYNRYVSEKRCTADECKSCKLYSENNGTYDELPCKKFCMIFQESAARLMGYEVIEDELTEPDQTIKADKDKYRPTLVPTGIIKAIARVREYGHQKYGDGADKWAEIDKNRYKDALYRHWLAYLDGEEVDKESGLSHLWHMATNLDFIIELEGVE